MTNVRLRKDEMITIGAADIQILGYLKLKLSTVSLFVQFEKFVHLWMKFRWYSYENAYLVIFYCLGCRVFRELSSLASEKDVNLWPRVRRCNS